MVAITVHQIHSHADGCERWRGASWPREGDGQWVVLCAPDSCLYCPIFLESTFAALAVRKAPAFKILQSISCLKISKKNQLCKTGIFFLIISFKMTRRKHCVLRHATSFLQDRYACKSHRLCTDPTAQCTGPRFSRKLLYLQSNKL